MGEVPDALISVVHSECHSSAGLELVYSHAGSIPILGCVDHIDLNRVNLISILITIFFLLGLNLIKLLHI